MPQTFRVMSGGRGDVDAVLAAIAAAERAGFAPLKINAVVMRGVNDAQVLDLVEHFRGSGHIVRFIEYMDVGTCNDWRRDLVVPSAELRERIAARWPLVALAANYGGEVARAPCVRRRRRRNRLHQLGHASRSAATARARACRRMGGCTRASSRARVTTCAGRCAPARATQDLAGIDPRGLGMHATTATAKLRSEPSRERRAPSASKCTRSAAETMARKLSHVDPAGRPRMVDVGAKSADAAR